MQRLYPAPAADLEPTAIYDDLWRALPEPPEDRPYVLLNMVTSVDGKAAVAGSAAPIGSDVDHRLMRSIRAAVDAVLNGGGTLRTERIDPRVGQAWSARRATRGVPPEPMAILLTSSGDIPLDRRYFTYPNVPRLVICGAETPTERREALAAHAALLVAPTARPDVTWALRQLRTTHGIRHLLVEGGPTVNGELIAAGLVDELCWTLAPKIIGSGESLPLVAGPPLPAPARLSLLSAYLHEDEFFLRYRFVAQS
ncbi:MAG: dihydrofolate reductase family protein [Chloroflexia bacterium]